MSRVARIARGWKLGALAVAAFASSCSVSGVVGALYLTSASVTTSGGSLSISPAQSATLAGATIELPAGALSATTVIGVEQSSDVPGGDWVAIGPAITWEPAAQPLLAPAQFSLPAKVPNGIDPDDLTVLTIGPGGSARIFGQGLQFDAQSDLVRFSAQHLGRFQAVIGAPCTVRNGCLAGDVCERGQCLPGEGDDGGLPP